MTMKRLERRAFWYVYRDDAIVASTEIRTLGDAAYFADCWVVGRGWCKSIKHPTWEAALSCAKDWTGHTFRVEDALEREESWTDGEIVHSARRRNGLYECSVRAVRTHKIAYISRNVVSIVPGQLPSWEAAVEMGRSLVPIVRAALATIDGSKGVSR